VWRKYVGFFVLYRAAALEVAKGNEDQESGYGLGGRHGNCHPVPILADSLARSQCEAGQKEIDMAILRGRM
jgi:hypothetical protein